MFLSRAVAGLAIFFRSNSCGNLLTCSGVACTAMWGVNLVSRLFLGSGAENELPTACVLLTDGAWQKLIQKDVLSAKVELKKVMNGTRTVTS